MTENAISIHWFRQDLRLNDNPSLYHTAAQGTVLPIYILDIKTQTPHPMGTASRVWLHHALAALNDSLGGNLCYYIGDPIEILKSLTERFSVTQISWNRCYSPWQQQRDTAIKAHFNKKGISTKSYNGSLLWEPWEIQKTDGTPYRVFTPFYKKGCLSAPVPRTPYPAPTSTHYTQDTQDSLSLHDLNLLPNPRWDRTVAAHWQIGEAAAQTQYDSFIENGLKYYKEGRNIPAKPYVSRLSPYLRFGNISAHQLWHRLNALTPTPHIEHFRSELGWREFSYSQLYYNPPLPEKNLQSKFDAFPWQQNAHYLHAWKTGQTGIPIVDAGMRQLWQTGYLHNRVRMIVGSFLVKNLRLHWREGAAWFWDTLFDADLANNSASWQWIAGCGADAAPYFRIFNPVTQSQKFDSEGQYIRQFIPELSLLPNKYLFVPWEAPQEILNQANVKLGNTYPQPIVDLKQSRETALQAFASLKQES